jgi:hypothetical protein
VRNRWESADVLKRAVWPNGPDGGWQCCNRCFLCPLRAWARALLVPIWPLGHTVLFRTSPSPGQFLIPSYGSHAISHAFYIFFPCPITSNYPTACLLITRQSPRGPYKGPFRMSMDKTHKHKLTTVCTFVSSFYKM